MIEYTHLDKSWLRKGSSPHANMGDRDQKSYSLCKVSATQERARTVLRTTLNYVGRFGKEMKSSNETMNDGIHTAKIPRLRLAGQP